MLLPESVHAQQKCVSSDRKLFDDVIVDAAYTPEADARLEYEGCPSIVASANGKEIYSTWYARGTKIPNQIGVSISLDEGKAWTINKLVVQPNGSSKKISDPALWRDNKGKIWLFFTSWPASIPTLYASQISWDGTHIQYTDPINISTGIMLNKPVCVSGKDFALFPVSIWRNLKPSKSGKIQAGAFIHRVDYKAENESINTLTPYSELEGLTDEQWAYDEHQIVQTSSTGNFLALLRGKDGLHFSTSTDDGKTWTSLSPFKAVDPAAPSRFHISRLQSGNLLLILNHSERRSHMTAFLSEDGGKTWPHQLLLDKRRKVSYPDASQTEDGAIHIIYDRDRQEARDIIHIRISEADIIKGDEKNARKKRINPR